MAGPGCSPGTGEAIQRVHPIVFDKPLGYEAAAGGEPLFRWMNLGEMKGCSLRGKDHRQGLPVEVVARSLVEGEIRDFWS